MIRSSVTISLVPEARGGPFVFWDDLHGACQEAASLGFDAVEIFAPGADALDAGSLRQLLDEHGLHLAAVGTGAGWVLKRLSLTDADANVRASAIGFIRSIIDFGAGFGAPAIIGSMQGRWGGDVDQATAFGYLHEALEELGEHAARQHVPLVYEPLNRYETNMICTLTDGVKLLESLSTANVKLLADLFHMNIEEVKLADAIRAAAGHVGHVHFVDSNRRPAGSGHLDFRPIAAALETIGSNGYASAEALPLPNPDEAARLTIEAFRQYFR